MISPCVRLCNISNGSCTGCGRTIDEIRNWTIMTSSERLDVMYRLSKQKTNADKLRNYDKG